jgi:hypothetical protein
VEAGNSWHGAAQEATHLLPIGELIQLVNSIYEVAIAFLSLYPGLPELPVSFRIREADPKEKARMISVMLESVYCDTTRKRIVALKPRQDSPNYTPAVTPEFLAHISLLTRPADAHRLSAPIRHGVHLDVRGRPDRGPEGARFRVDRA